ncbi:hypothetical protein [Sulfurimonas sp.]|uniref:hypothetical protein n=1 Tax=Sulfurimonas sp. TaxID=2022749 RepID=UPI00356A1A34
MLRVVLGGIALAATAYGLKKYVEDNDKHYEVENVGFKIIDGIDVATEKTDNFFNYLIKQLDSLDDEDTHIDVTTELNTLEQIDKIKEKFYDDSILKLLEYFSNIKDLPDYDMEQFYKLQQKFKKEDVKFSSLEQNTQNALEKYLSVLNNGIDKLEEFLDSRIDDDTQTVDYHTLSVEEKEQISDVYLLATGLIEFCYSKTIDEDNKFSKQLQRQILLFKKLTELYF